MCAALGVTAVLFVTHARAEPPGEHPGTLLGWADGDSPSQSSHPEPSGFILGKGMEDPVQDTQDPLLQPRVFICRDIAATVNEVLNELTGLALISLMPDLNPCNSINLVG